MIRRISRRITKAQREWKCPDKLHCSAGKESQRAFSSLDKRLSCAPKTKQDEIRKELGPKYECFVCGCIYINLPTGVRIFGSFSPADGHWIDNR